MISYSYFTWTRDDEDRVYLLVNNALGELVDSYTLEQYLQDPFPTFIR